MVYRISLSSQRKQQPQHHRIMAALVFCEYQSHFVRRSTNSIHRMNFNCSKHTNGNRTAQNRPNKQPATERPHPHFIEYTRVQFAAVNMMCALLCMYTLWTNVQHVKRRAYGVKSLNVSTLPPCNVVGYGITVYIKYIHIVVRWCDRWLPHVPYDGYLHVIDGLSFRTYLCSSISYSSAAVHGCALCWPESCKFLIIVSHGLKSLLDTLFEHVFLSINSYIERISHMSIHFLVHWLIFGRPKQTTDSAINFS